MGLTGDKVPPPLRDAIARQTYVADDRSAVYACGCRVEPYDSLLLDALWTLCDRHASTMLQAGRMLR